MMKNDPIHNLSHIRDHIRHYEQVYHRKPGTVSLLAVSKTFPAAQVLTLNRVGQQDFGESYLLEAITKISALCSNFITWHFIGMIQTNKTKQIAQNFSWVHTVCRLKEAQRLSQARGASLPPLNLCIQVKLDANPKKNGIAPCDVKALALQIQTLPFVKLRGLMTVPPISDDFEEQRKYFRQIADLQAELITQGIDLDTLSMGMTHDLEAAIAEGATIVRVGRGLFGARSKQSE